MPMAILTTGLLLNAYTSIRYARRPLTVLKSRIVIDIDCPNGHLARTTRKQLLRAEQPGVRARYRHIAEDKGEIDLAGLTHSRIPENDDDELLKFGDEKKATVVCKFADPLPYSWLGQLLIPDFLFRLFVKLKDDEHLPEWMARFVALEQSSLLEIGEYCRKTAWFNLIAQRYVSSSVQLIVRFHRDNPPVHFHAYVLRSPSIDDIATSRATEKDGTIVCSVTFPPLRDETATVAWELSHEPVPPADNDVS